MNEHLPSPEERIKRIKEWLDDPKHKMLLNMTEKIKIELNVSSDRVVGQVTSYPSS